APVTTPPSPTSSAGPAPRLVVPLSCPAAPAAVGGVITYSGTVSNPGNVGLNNIVVVNNQARPSAVTLTVTSLAPGASANFTTSFTAPADACSVSATVSASGSDACSGAVV